MSDWNLYELEDISWDVFGDSCNHLVPLTLEQINETGGHLDSHKKARHDVCDENESDAEKTEENEKNIAENNEQLSLKDGTPNTNASEQCTDASKNVSSIEECIDGAVALGSTDVKRANADIEFSKNEQNCRSSCDLLDYEWPDFEGFDVDNLFRNGYSTFGEGSSATTNEVSWFPSCYDKTDASEDPSHLNFKSSCSEMNAFKAASDHHVSSNINWNDYGKVASGSYESSNFGYESYDHWLYPDAQNKEDIYSKETINGSKDIDKATFTKNLETSTVSYEESSMVAKNVSISSQGTKGKKLGQNLEFIGSCGDLDQMAHYGGKKRDLVEDSTQETYICQIHGDPKNFLVPRPLNFQPPDLPFLGINNNDVSRKFLTCSSPVGNSRKERKMAHLNKEKVQASSKFHQSVPNNPSPSSSSQMTTEKKTEESHLRTHLLAKLSIGNKGKKSSSQNASSNQRSTKRMPHKLEKEAGGCSELENASIASFRQLQDVMNQLDIRTKLCMRDGLYRLARNAELRHVTDNTRRDDRVSMTKSTGMNELHSAPGFMDMETGTNPIDRSIAHLLFSKPSEPPFSPADDTISLESRIVNRKNAGVAAKSEMDGSRTNS